MENQDKSDKKDDAMLNVTNDKNIVKEDNKIEALDFILTNSLKSGFGTLSKSELDLILFTAILKYSGSKENSDYNLSKYLQITQQRIRNLKEKASVKYLAINREEAIKKFIEKSEYAKIETIYIDVPVNDVSVKNEIEELLDKNNILMHYQLNPKIFRMRIDDFYEFSIILEIYKNPQTKKETLEKKVITAIKNKAKSDAKLKEKLNRKGWDLESLSTSTIKEALIKGGFSFGIELLASIIPGGVFASGYAKQLLEKISSKI